MKTNRHSIFLIVLSSFFSVYAGLGNCIDILYCHKNYLSDLHIRCEPVDFKGLGKIVVPCGGKENSSFFQDLIQKDMPLSEWHKNKLKIVDFFIGFYSKSYRVDSIKYSLVNNDSLVSIMISCLSDTTDVSNLIIEQGLNLLLYKTARPQIVKHGIIIRKIRNQNLLKYNKYIDLFILSNSDKFEADSLLKSDTALAIYHKARLGDTVAENQLIDNFNHEKNYQVKKALIEQLFFVGTSRCLQCLIRHFNEPIYNICPDGTIGETLWNPILSGFHQLFPNDKLFSDEYERFLPISLAENNITSDELTMSLKIFIHNFLKWSNAKFKVKPEREPDKFILKGWCAKN